MSAADALARIGTTGLGAEAEGYRAHIRSWAPAAPALCTS